MFDPDGDQAAADSTRSSTSLGTGSSVNPRTARRLVTASYTSMIAYLPPDIAMPVADGLLIPLGDDIARCRGYWRRKQQRDYHPSSSYQHESLPEHD